MCIKIKLFDWHCDTLSKISGFSDGKPSVTPEYAASFEALFQVFAVYCPDGGDDETSYLRAKRQIETFHKHKNIRDIYNNESAGSGGGAALSLENSVSLKNGAATLEEFYSYGVRLFSLTHNGENRFASGSRAGGGLKKEGRLLLSAAERLDIAVDVSHLNFQSFYDTINSFSQGKLMATHSCAYSICEHPRNLKDDMARLIWQRNGLVAVTIVPEFLGHGRDIDAVIDHILHFLLIGGEGRVGLGCDLDGTDYLPKGIENPADILKIAARMSQRGFSEPEINDIFYNNSNKFWNTYNLKGSESR